MRTIAVTSISLALFTPISIEAQENSTTKPTAAKPTADSVQPPVMIGACLAGVGYTKEAYEAAIEGRLLGQINVDRKGQVTGAKVLEGLGYGLDEGFELALWNCRFEPARRSESNETVEAQLKLAARFRYTRKSKADFQRDFGARSPAIGALFYKSAARHAQLGSYKKASSLFRRAAQLNHIPALSSYKRASVLALAAEPDAALFVLRKALQLGYDNYKELAVDPDFESLRERPEFEAILKDIESLSLRGLLADQRSGKKIKTSSWTKSAERLETYLNLHPESAQGHYNLGYAALQAGQITRAEQALGRAYELGHRQSLVVTAYELTCALALAERRELAFVWLDRVIELGGTGKTYTLLLERDTDLDSLRDDRRFPVLDAPTYELAPVGRLVAGPEPIDGCLGKLKYTHELLPIGRQAWRVLLREPSAFKPPDGRVVLETVIDREGKAGETRLLEGTGFGLDEEAIKTLKACRFKPGYIRKINEPVDVIYRLTVNFKMRP